MNNEQKAEDYAAKICEIYQSSVHDTRWLHDVVTEAVLHGIEIGQESHSPFTKEELESIRIALEVVMDTPFYASSPTMQGVASIISKVSKLTKSE